jgi:pre-mRNA-splicing factor ISY1
MLNKWVKMREEEDPNSLLSRRAAQRAKRPYLATQCEHLADAERFRLQIISEISNGIKKIQNPGMGEHAIRDLNDQINKLIREKWHWNRRIKELGGKDYNKEERKAMLQAEEQGGTGLDGREDPQLAIGLALKGSGGYRYFGAAKELPGVKELFARHAAKMTKRKRGDIYKYITPDYYGLRDEEDGVLLELEEKMAEDRRKKLKECQDEYKQIAKEQNQGQDDASDQSNAAFVKALANGIPAHVAVPSQDAVAQLLLAKKKEALLSRFA